MTDDDRRDLAEDIAEEWGAKFPTSRFSGRTVETARISVGPQEIVDLIEQVLLQHCAGGAG